MLISHVYPVAARVIMITVSIMISPIMNEINANIAPALNIVRNKSRTKVHVLSLVAID